ncbi:MAG: hypothetical protein A2Y24_01450 [Clostridiales bacterium GWE2_32_10]|nr:MAG: hypothetical protein A2Y24_01450 [Clostridiales bacterium GWE2_32_10]HBY19995.1 hypothetical protein [Clostridiales bacterium]
MEIERKFILKSLPQTELGEKIEYKRHFIYSKDGVEMRIQQKGNMFELERKEKIDNLVSKKEKIEITKEEFDTLKTISNASIERDSYVISVEGREVSLKVYRGVYEGLIRAEVEFATKEEAEGYVPPNWFGREITDTVIGKDSNLINFSRKDFTEEMEKYKN